MTAVHELLDFRLRDVFDVRPAVVEHANFFGIGVESGDSMSGFGKAEGEGKADVATANDGDFQLAAFEKFGSFIRRHEGEKAPNLKKKMTVPRAGEPGRIFNIAASRVISRIGEEILAEIYGCPESNEEKRVERGVKGKAGEAGHPLFESPDELS